MSLTLDVIRQMVHSMNLQWSVWCLVISGLSLSMCGLAVAMSVLSYGCISREGKDYSVLKTLPVPMETIVMVKRDVAMLFNGISGVLFPMLITIAGVVLDLLPAWTIALMLLVSTAWLVVAIDMCCLFGLRKPNLNWDAEADACKNNMPGLIFWLVSFVAVIMAMFTVGDYDISGEMLQIIAVAVCALPIVLALVLDAMLRRKAAGLADRV